MEKHSKRLCDPSFYPPFTPIALLQAQERRRPSSFMEDAESFFENMLETDRKGAAAKRLLLPVSLLVLTAVLASAVGCEKKQERPQAGPPEVLVTEVTQKDVAIFGEWVATLNGPVNADITPKVQGYLLTQNYVNGSLVKKGQLLFLIDSRPFQAALDQARAEVERAASSLSKATNDVQRDTPLAAQSAIPQKQLDDDVANQAWAKSELAAKKAAQEQAE